MDQRYSGKSWGYLSRGYGRSSTDFRWVSAVDTAAKVGDEALMAAARRPEKTVGVAANRRRGLSFFAAESRCAGVVLDDVLQHRWVQPTAMLVACPWDRPWDQESLLPAGTLRDFPRSAGRAQAVVVTGTPSDATREEMVLLAAPAARR
jgi:tetraacyldisaccharide 4'-kinase